VGYPENVLADDEQCPDRHPHWKRLIAPILCCWISTAPAFVPHCHNQLGPDGQEVLYIVTPRSGHPGRLLTVWRFFSWVTTHS